MSRSTASTSAATRRRRSASSTRCRPTSCARATGPRARKCSVPPPEPPGRRLVEHFWRGAETKVSAPLFIELENDMSLKQFADTLPDFAKDLRLNLSSLLSDQLLGDQRKYGLILACAHGSGYRPLVAAAEAECAPKLSPEAANAARGAAAVMGQNNVYYRFVHLASNPVYSTLPAKLRMNLIGSHGIDKADFELFS